MPSGEGGKGSNGPTSPSAGMMQAGGRGLDSGLAKTAPVGENLTQKTYRSYRRRLVLFSKQCHRRGRETAVEGAFLAVSLLGDAAWEATEHLDLDALEASDKPFDTITKLLDGLYQYEELVEVPSRCEEFFQEFSRNKGEDMQSYLVRHMTMMKRMKEIKVEIPKLLAGWHFLTRAGVPKWTHVQVKSMCGGELDYDKVSLALMRMFGGDHRPNPIVMAEKKLSMRMSRQRMTATMRTRPMMIGLVMAMTMATTMRSATTKMLKNLCHLMWRVPLTRLRRPMSTTWSLVAECETWLCREAFTRLWHWDRKLVNKAMVEKEMVKEKEKESQKEERAKEKESRSPTRGTSRTGGRCQD